jgi:hypothetical protein
MSPQLGIAAGAAAAAFALFGWLGARWLDRRAVGPRPGLSWLVVPLGILVGAGAGYGLGVVAGAEVEATATGAAVGLALGTMALLLWRRAHPRVRGTGGAYKLTGIPTSALDDISKEAAAELLRRWLTLAPGRLVRVAIVPASPKLTQLAGDIAAWLHGLQAEAAGGHPLNGSAPQPAPRREAVPALSTEGQDPSAPTRPQWRSRWSPRGPYPSPAAPAGGQRDGTGEPEPAQRLVTLDTGLTDPELLHENLVVLLAEDGMMSRELTDHADRLENLGCRPEWMLLTRSPDAAHKRLGPQAGNGAGPAQSRRS